MDPRSALALLDFSKSDGFVTAIAQDAETGEILMVAPMNEESFVRTLETGQAVYWSRSRETLWHKGQKSGFVQKVVELRIDDDPLDIRNARNELRRLPMLCG